MSKIDLDEFNVSVVNMTVNDVRLLLDEMDDGDLPNELDKAQGLVFGQTVNVAYVVVKITPD